MVDMKLTIILLKELLDLVALGRKNYLFARSHKAAENAAMAYSFFVSCKMNKVDPYAWLTDVLERISVFPANRLEELLPHN